MEWLKATGPQGESGENVPEELKGKFILGELYSATKPEFSEYMRAIGGRGRPKGRTVEGRNRRFSQDGCGDGKRRMLGGSKRRLYQCQGMRCASPVRRPGGGF